MFGGACMRKSRRAISNASPLIHLAEIGCFNILDIWEMILIPQEVFDEVCKFEAPGSKEVRKSENISVHSLTGDSKNLAKRLALAYELNLGEAAAIALARQEGISLFFTDDLDARLVALSLGLTVHGSVGILLRAFREKMLTKDGVISKVRMLETQSSLFITRDLINFIIKEINEYREQ